MLGILDVGLDLASVDAELWALDRAEFLAAVTGSVPALREAERVAEARLA